MVEFNARFGDPETQVVLPLLETPLAGLLHAAATGTLAAHPPLRWRDGDAVTVVLAAPGYPGHRAAATWSPAPSCRACCTPAPAAADGAVVSAGGRVLAVVGGRRRPRRRPGRRVQRVPAIHLAGAHFRTDIAGRRRGPDAVG